ncbi:STT3 domain-containing protein [Nitrosopumilus sp. S6]
MSFSISFLIRAQPADWGWELNEFDPFFNFRATQYVVENGVNAYFEWDDNLSWYPHGRDVSSNSQVMLHLTTATTYWIFGGNNNLYDFTIMFPVIIGSLTCVVVFALVRVIGGTTAGLFSTLLFSISLPILIRGQLGWFKSEPLGLFFGILGLYLFLSGIRAKNHKISFLKLVGAGLFIIFGFSAWGGIQFFIIPLGVFFFVLPFVRRDHNFLLWSIPVFTISALITSLGFERLGSDFILGLGGLSLIVPTVFLVMCIIIQKKSVESKKIRNGLLLLIAILIIGPSLLVMNVDSDFIPLPSFRYLNAINPFLTTTDPLVDSVSEHATTTIQQSFLFHSVLMIFAGLGIWLILKTPKKYPFIQNDMVSFSLIIGLSGMYLSSAFVRLEVFASFSIIILSSLSLSILSKEFISKNHDLGKFKKFTFKSSYVIGIIILLTLPLAFTTPNIVSTVDNPPTILNGGTHFQISTDDWNDSLEWIKNNTPEDAVIASWWDYGYWIQTKADRATLADNATVSTLIIQKIAEILIGTPENSWKSLDKMEADYFVIFVSGQRLDYVGPNNQPLYVLGGGADESKKQWFMRIANEPLNKYLHVDGSSGTDYFWNNTLLGKMIPYSVVGYINIQTNQQSLTYQPGYTPLYEKNIKFSNDDQPFKLVYSSPSFNVEESGVVLGVFVYEINKDFVP